MCGWLVVPGGEESWAERDVEGRATGSLNVTMIRIASNLRVKCWNKLLHLKNVSLSLWLPQ